MGWNAFFAVLPDGSVGEPAVTGAATLSFDEVCTADATELVATRIGGHVLLIDPEYGERAISLATDRGVRAELVLLHSVSDTYLVEAVGPDGEPTRRRFAVEGEVVEEFGDPLPAEDAAQDVDDAEDAHLGILESLVGASWADIMAARFVVVTHS